MNETSWNNFGLRSGGYGVDSMYQLITVAAQRNKQLVRGATPRINVSPLMRRSTTIALEETRRGLVPFTTHAAQETNNDGSAAPSEPVVGAVADAPARVEKEKP